MLNRPSPLEDDGKGVGASVDRPWANDHVRPRKRTSAASTSPIEGEGSFVPSNADRNTAARTIRQHPPDRRLSRPPVMARLGRAIHGTRPDRPPNVDVS